MLYPILKIPADVAIKLYCRDVKISNKKWLNAKGPLLIASNHPNSFLDAIILATLFKQPIYSLARGDAFSNKFTHKLLRWLYMLPVYRLSEGADKLQHNYSTFDECISIFKNNGLVLIFSEGSSINEWNIRPLKKGTARLAITAWQQNIPLTILPIGINYDSFRTFGKNVQINIGEPFHIDDFDINSSEGTLINDINTKLSSSFQALVYQQNSNNKKEIQQQFEVPVSNTKKTLLYIPSIVGYVTHLPLYLPIKKLFAEKITDKDHYDSILVGLLFILYPFYWFAISLLCAAYINVYTGVAIALLLPFCAWSYLQLKKQF